MGFHCDKPPSLEGGSGIQFVAVDLKQPFLPQHFQFLLPS